MKSSQDSLRKYEKLSMTWFFETGTIGGENTTRQATQTIQLSRKKRERQRSCSTKFRRTTKYPIQNILAKRRRLTSGSTDSLKTQGTTSPHTPSVLSQRI